MAKPQSNKSSKKSAPRKQAVKGKNAKVAKAQKSKKVSKSRQLKKAIATVKQHVKRTPTSTVKKIRTPAKSTPRRGTKQGGTSSPDKKGAVARQKSGRSTPKAKTRNPPVKRKAASSGKVAAEKKSQVKKNVSKSKNPKLRKSSEKSPSKKHSEPKSPLPKKSPGSVTKTVRKKSEKGTALNSKKSPPSVKKTPARAQKRPESTGRTRTSSSKVSAASKSQLKQQDISHRFKAARVGVRGRVASSSKRKALPLIGQGTKRKVSSTARERLSSFSTHLRSGRMAAKGVLPTVRLRRETSKSPRSPVKKKSPVKVADPAIQRNIEEQPENKASEQACHFQEVVVSDGKSQVQPIPRLDPALVSQSPQIKIDLSGATLKEGKSGAEKSGDAKKSEKLAPTPKKEAPKKPVQSSVDGPKKSATSCAQQKLMQTLAVSPEQAENLVKTLIRSAQHSGSPQVVKFLVAKDGSGRSTLQKMQASSVEDKKKTDEKVVSYDLSNAEATKASQSMATKKPAFSLDFSSAELTPKHVEPEKKRALPLGEIHSEGASSAKKMKSADASLQEFLKNHTSKQTSSAAAEGVSYGSPDEKKTNIIVRCSACKNYFEPGADFANHKVQCLELHARCPNCQKYFPRGGEFDNHVSQCSSPGKPQGEMGKSQWLDIINAKKPEGKTTPSFKCLVCKKEFSDYRSMREHEEMCAVVKPGSPGGVMCTDCRMAFVSRILLSRHKTQHPGCPAKPKKKSSASKPEPEQIPINLMVTFNNGVPEVNVNMGTEQKDNNGDANTKEIKSADERFAEEDKDSEPGDGMTESERDLVHVEGVTLADGGSVSKCPLCNKMFKHIYFLKKHFRSFHHLDFGTFVKSCTDKEPDVSRNPRSEALRAQSTEQKGCTCLDCGHWVSSRVELNYHKRVCANRFVPKTLFSCTLCAKGKFPSRLELYDHMREMHSEDAQLINSLTFTCDVCDAKFSEKASLLRHRTEQHPDYSPDQKNLSGSVKRRCLDCGLMVMDSQFNFHKESCNQHLVSKPFVCFDCHEQFSTRNQLTKHKRAEHMFNGTLYTCWQCFQVFNVYLDLVHHVQEVHRGGKEAMASSPTKSSQKVFMVQGDANLVKLNMVSSQKSDGKSVVLDLSKIKGLVNADDPKNVVTVPLSALQDEEGEEAPHMESAEVENVTSGDGDPQETASKEEEEDEQKSPEQPKKFYQPTILKRSPRKKQEIHETSPAQSSPSKLLQVVGKNQVQCRNCSQVLATMVDVATHVCLTDGI